MGYFEVPRVIPLKKRPFLVVVSTLISSLMCRKLRRRICSGNATLLLVSLQGAVTQEFCQRCLLVTKRGPLK